MDGLVGTSGVMEAKMSSRSSMPAFRAQKSRRLCQEKVLEKAEARASQDETSVGINRIDEGSSGIGGGFISRRATCQWRERRC